MQQVVVISYRRFGTTRQSPVDGTGRLSQNVGKKLPLIAV
jgi:hypothetical protein